MQNSQSDLNSAKNPQNSQSALQNAMNSHSFNNAKNGNAPSKAAPKAAQPLVSIIVPIYNVAAYLSECLQSLTEQSYEALDIILIDDGSDDESLKIALDFAAHDGRIFVVSKPNGGLSSARNFGLEFVRGTGLREFFERGVNFGSNNINLQENLQNAAIASLRGTQCRSNPREKGVSATMDCFEPNGSRNDEQGENSQNSAPFRHTERSEVSINQGVNLNVDSSPATQAQNDGVIQTLTHTHTFKKTYKSISGKEIQAHFTKIASNFIKSDLTKISTFITQELPPNALIHFVDSDDYLTKDCIEKCVGALCEQGLEVVAHNYTHFYEKNGYFKDDIYLNEISQNAYESNLEQLNNNKFTSLYFSIQELFKVGLLNRSFYFTWQGLFRAGLLNHYALRFSEGIYYEDHDFGALLFCLADKIAYINKPLYVYRERANSITTSYQNIDFPTRMPYFLEPLRVHFSDYKALRAYFDSYCYVFIASRIYDFCQSCPKQRRYFKKFIKQCINPYIDTFYNTQNLYSQNAADMLAKMGYKNLKFWYHSRRLYFLIRSYWRHPKKFLQIFDLKKDKNEKS